MLIGCLSFTLRRHSMWAWHCQVMSAAMLDCRIIEFVDFKGPLFKDVSYYAYKTFQSELLPFASHR